MRKLSPTGGRRRLSLAATLMMTTSLLAGPLALATAAAQAQEASGGQDGSGAQGGAESEAPSDVLKIEAEAPKDGQTEGSGTYASGSSTAGSRFATDVREVPQTITVIGREQLDDQNLNTVEEALNWHPGITVATGDLYSASFYARGHEIFNYSVDGAVRPLQSIYGSAPDLFFFDRVEVLSGPAGLLNGAGEPGAAINLGRKRAQRDFMVSGSGFAGRWEAFRGEADLNVPLTEDGRARARVAAFGETEDSFVDVVDESRGGAYATTEFDIGESTTFSLGGLYERFEVTRFAGLPAFTDGTLLDVDRSTFIGADFNEFRRDAADFFGELEHAFDDGAQLRLHARVWTADHVMHSIFAGSGVDPATGNFSLTEFGRRYDETSGWVDVSYAQPFEIAGLESEVTLGGDLRRSSQEMRQQLASAGTANIDNFDSSAFTQSNFTYPGCCGPTVNNETEIVEYGAFVQGKVEVFDGFTLLGGGRVTSYENETTNMFSGASSTLEANGEITPYAGITYDFLDNFTAYASYTGIFQPQDETEVSGDPLDPREGEQFEIGLKSSLFDDRLTGQISFYHLEDSNRAVDDPSNPGFSVNSGEVRTRGIDVQIAGKPIPEVDLVVGYAFTDTKIEEDPTAAFGSLTPEHSFRAWGKYSILNGPLDGLSFGAGVRAVSDFFSVAQGVKIEADGYAVVDAQIAYEFNENFSASLTASNLFDETYYQRVGYPGRANFYGEPFNVLFRVNAKF